jgi:hypothetical protein
MFIILLTALILIFTGAFQALANETPRTLIYASNTLAEVEPSC